MKGAVSDVEVLDIDARAFTSVNAWCFSSAELNSISNQRAAIFDSLCPRVCITSAK
jgi:hypothetical protein